MKRISLIFVIIVAITAVLVFALNKKSRNGLTESSKMKIVASFYPLAEFAKQIGGEQVEVVNIVPPGLEPHDFDPSSQDIAKTYSATLFIFNGSGFDPWAEKISPELEKKNIAIIKMTQYFNLLESIDEQEGEGNIDSHIWLDPVLAQKEVEIIKDAFKAIDPDNSLTYELNAENYLSKLSELDKKYRDGLASCAIRDAIVSHSAFGYLANRYGINIIPIAGISPEEEPSPRRISEIAEIARQKNIKYIFFETLVSPKLAETIANEIGAETLLFNPLEGLTKEELTAGKNYISIMEENLTSLRQALLCS